MLELILKRWILTSMLICIGAAPVARAFQFPTSPSPKATGHLATGGSEMAGLAG